MKSIKKKENIQKVKAKSKKVKAKSKKVKVKETKPKFKKVETKIQLPKKRGRPKKPVGRNTKYDPTWMDATTEQLLAEGYSKVAVAAELGVSKGTILVWEQKHESFFNAVERGMAKCQMWWEDKGRNQFLDEKFNSQIYSLIMNNRFGYSKKIETVNDTKVTHSGKVKIKNESDPTRLAEVLKVLIDSGVFEQISKEEITTKTD